VGILNSSTPPPFKLTHVGTKKNIWSDNVESSRKDFERCFGILKKRWRCFLNHVELQDPDHIERLFNACTILHNILLEYDGIYDWENRMKNARFDRKYYSFYVSSVNNRAVEDILYNEKCANAPSANFLITWTSTAILRLAV
jgi:hypothetical protein